ncbi:MAG: POTRA domain-containing protein [Bacteroidota bacterium]
MVLQPVDQDTFFINENISYQNQFGDSLAVINELSNVVQQLHNRSYFEASIDSLIFTDSTATAQLYVGELYEWSALKNGNVDEVFLEKSGFREKLYKKKMIRLSELQELKEQIVEQAENNGYPFASVYLDSIFFEQNKVNAKLFLTKGKPVFFDSLNWQGDIKISKSYLRNYLGIQPGDPYSRKKILQIKNRIQELPFLKEKENVLVDFLDDKANVNLTLEKNKASRFDFLLGVLPDNGRLETRLLITGTFNAEMHNQFGLGERIFLSFERLRPQTQELEMAFAYPYILDLPFGVDLKFNQYRRDSTYTDIIGEAGVQYLFAGGNYLKAFWRTASSNLISVDTSAIRRGSFPNVLDVRNNYFGLEVNWQKLDYRFNPRKGWRIMATGSAGTRQINENQAILEVNESFYDTLAGRTFRFNIEGTLEYYFPVMERSALKTSARTAAIISEEGIFFNEQYRIGGNQLLRGFDEESIFATFYTVFTLEYRLLVGQNSYFYAFGDYAYIEDRISGKPLRVDHPLGFGGGITFETGAGVFGISVAAGQTDEAPADFRNPKIHFGYVSIF